MLNTRTLDKMGTIYVSIEHPRCADNDDTVCVTARLRSSTGPAVEHSRFVALHPQGCDDQKEPVRERLVPVITQVIYALIGSVEWAEAKAIELAIMSSCTVVQDVLTCSEAQSQE